MEDNFAALFPHTNFCYVLLFSPILTSYVVYCRLNSDVGREGRTSRDYGSFPIRRSARNFDNHQVSSFIILEFFISYSIFRGKNLGIDQNDVVMLQICGQDSLHTMK